MNSKIAVIGMSCRVPKANNIYEFWNNILLGEESITIFSDEELIKAGVLPDLIDDRNYVKKGFVLKDTEYFDADFFKYSPKDATLMDPQHRLLLECVWEALENASCIQELQQKSVGVFTSSNLSHYFLNIYSDPNYVKKNSEMQIGVGNKQDFLASKISYKLGLKGPSINVQTACSSSLAAVHLATQSLLLGECDIAIAGGVSVQSNQITGYYYQPEGMTSPDGHCRVFDEKSAGTVFGNGLGVVVLKRLEDAIRNKDNIISVISGTAINNDGADKIGYTAPSQKGQASVICEALAVAGVSPSQIGYIETHGTGTLLGDMVEIKALKEVFMEHKYTYQSCAIGSVKPNIGHLDIASGIMGFIKTSLSLYYGMIPPCINHEMSNLSMSFEESPFYVNTKSVKWSEVSESPKAGVSSFGIGGTNVHVILEKAPSYENDSNEKKKSIFLLSGNNEEALKKTCKNMLNYMQNNPEKNLENISYTLKHGRKFFEYRTMIVANNRSELMQQLNSNQFEICNQKSHGVSFVYSSLPHNIKDIMDDLCRNDEFFQKIMNEMIRKISGEIEKLESLESFLNIYDDSQIQNQHHMLHCLIFDCACTDYLIKMGVVPEYLVSDETCIYSTLYYSSVIELCDIIQVIRLVQQWKKAQESEKRLIENQIDQFVKDMNLYDFKIPIVYKGKLLDRSSIRGSGFWLSSKNGSNERSNDWSKFDFNTVLRIGLKEKECDDLITLLNIQQNCVVNLWEEKYDRKENENLLSELLGKFWLRGYEIDWNKENCGKKLHKYSFSSTSFDRKKYWVDSCTPKQLEENQYSNKKEDVKDWFYHTVWKQSKSTNKKLEVNGDKECYVLFSNGSMLSEKVRKSIQRIGYPVYTVTKNSEFMQFGTYEYGVIPDNLDSFKKLFNSFLKYQSINLVYMWNLDERKNEEVYNSSITENFYEILNLGKVIQLSVSIQLVHLHVVTNNYLDIDGSEPVLCDQALVDNCIQVISQELSGVKSKLIDIKLSQMDASSSKAYDLLIEELTGEMENSVVAIRKSRKWIQIFERISIDKDSTHYNSPSDGIFIIFGGLGDIGLVAAQYLAEHNCKHLILTGKSKFPEESNWDEYKTKENNKIRKKIELLENIKRKGINLEIQQIDTCNLDQMTKFFEDIDKKEEKICAIIYSVGIVVKDFFANSIGNITREMCERDFTTKIQGVYNLAECINNRNIPFCLLNSSISAILGGIGLVSYAAANNYMNKFVEYQNQKPNNTKWLSVNWDAWYLEDNTIGEGDKKDQLAMNAIHREEGKTAFGWLLQNCAQENTVTVSTVDLFHRMNQKKKDIKKTRTIKSSSEYDMYSMELILADLIYDVTGIKDIKVNDNFIETGITSLAIIEINEILKEKINKPLNVVSWFKFPTIEKLAKYLLGDAKKETEKIDRSEIYSKGLSKMKMMKAKRNTKKTNMET